MSVSVALLALLLLGGMAWFWRHTRPVALPVAQCQRFGEAPAATAEVPKIIWTFWHSPELPATVATCIEGWRRLHPDYAIHVLNADSVQEFIDDIPEQLATLHITKQADWFRLNLLARYGGIWVDASVILTQPLASLYAAHSDAEFIGYYLERYTTSDTIPVVENWLMVATPGSRFVQDWLALFSAIILTEGTEPYLQRLRDEGRYTALTQAIGDPSYHTMHVAAQELLQHPKATQRYRLALVCAEQSAYVLQAHSQWRRKRLYAKLLWQTQQQAPAVIKLRGGERRKLDAYLKHRWYFTRSIVGRYLSSK